ncbi:MAG: hypothetical protein HC775_03630 [Hyellaceae cyanobacterium CSU_1_1]|nr:hypothetical protein [Hyellaceae cyanobacterium CSU_1_1]
MLQVDEAQACLEQAQQYWQSKQWQKTIQTCAQALVLNQHSPLAHKLMEMLCNELIKQKKRLAIMKKRLSFSLILWKFMPTWELSTSINKIIS